MKTLPLFALSLAVLVPGAAAQTATLAEDIAVQEPPFLFLGLENLHPVGQSLFFVDSDEPWVSDGTVSGTRILADCGSLCSYDPKVLGTLGDRLVYLNGQVWSTDGTPAGTVALTETNFEVDVSGSGASTLAGGRIYFRACQSGGFGDFECALWSTDGTRAGTGPVPVLTPGAEPETVYDLIAAGDRIYFAADDSTPSDFSDLWSADASGARRIAELPALRSIFWTTWGNLLFFLALDGEDPELWVSDGTAAGTRSVATFAGEIVNWLSTGPSGLHFIADDIVHGQEIWRSDGTPEGTRRVTEIGYFAPFYYANGSQAGWGHEIDGRVLFAADDQLTGKRLWMSSGKPESTRAVGRAELGHRPFRAGNRLFTFQYDESQDDCEAWSFDAQGTGTRLLDRLPRANCKFTEFSAYEIRTQAAGSRLYFSVQDGPSAFSVWRSDGTAQGTVRLVSLPSFINGVAVTAGESRLYVATAAGLWLWDAQNGPRQLLGGGVRNGSSFPMDLVSRQGKLFFTAEFGTASPGFTERTIWTSQGSDADTSLLLDETAAGCADPRQLASPAASLVFLCGSRDEIRSVPAAGGGSALLADGLPQNQVLLEHQGRVWFLRLAGLGPAREVWTTDGTPAGTLRLTDAGGSPIEGYFPGFFPPEPWAMSDGRFVYFFGARPGDAGLQLWRSDGTPTGTVSLRALSPGLELEAAGAGPTSLIKVSDQLWRTDGSAAGTSLLTRADGSPLLVFPHLLAAHGGFFYVYARQGQGLTLWRTDGTESGTVPLVPAFDWPGNVPGPRPVGLGTKLLFAAFDPEHGAELWTTDGTPAGTSRLADIAPGSYSSAPSGLVAAGGAVWFTAWDPLHGRELWRTDGTAAGTRLVQDLAPESRSSSPEQLKESGGRLFFSADDGVTGRELWSVPLDGPGSCQPSDTALCLQGGRFRVESRWRDFQGNGGVGKAVPLTGDTGTFWFFSPSNVEVLLKVLDGRGLNDHFWVFYGALSSVEYSLTVTDTQTGLTRRYSNPAGQLASAGDTQGFGPLGARSVFTAAPSPPPLTRGWSSAAATAPCEPGPRRLCLNNGRFAVEVAWKDFQGNLGQGTAVPFSGDTGFFWFFDQANVELAIKVLDGTPLNGKFWVFYGALSSVEYTITVTDTQTGSVREYRNPAGRFGSAGDTGAF